MGDIVAELIGAHARAERPHAQEFVFSLTM
jgi:hypothetical protein